MDLICEAHHLLGITLGSRFRRNLDSRFLAKLASRICDSESPRAVGNRCLLGALLLRDRLNTSSFRICSVSILFARLDLQHDSDLRVEQVRSASR